MARPKRVDPETLDLLRDLTRQRPDTAVVEITRQLSRESYLRVDKVLKAVGGRWDRRAGGHVFDHDTVASLAEKLDGLHQTGEFVSLAALGFFPSPPSVAYHVIHLAGLQPGMSVLEPSAGTGVLARAAHDVVGSYRLEGGRQSRVACYEVQDHLAERLRAAGFATSGLDFLRAEPGYGERGAGLFDRVVMNPPFAGGADVDHVTHAFGFLKPLGRLVAVMSPGWTFRTGEKWAAFRDLVGRHSRGRHGDFPEGSFKSSGTDVRTTWVVLDRPLTVAG